MYRADALGPFGLLATDTNIRVRKQADIKKLDNFRRAAMESMAEERAASGDSAEWPSIGRRPCASIGCEFDKTASAP